MSKAAQGLQDDLFVSGNSESKVAQVQSASQKRVQHIARRFAETGIKKMIKGIYALMRENAQSMKLHMDGVFAEIDPQMLPMEMECDIFLDLGENSNSNKIQKLGRIGAEVLPALNNAGLGITVKPQAPAYLATKMIEALGMDSNDFLEDYTTPEFQEKAAKQVEQQAQEAQKSKALEDRKMEADAALAEANVMFTGAQTKNTGDDNSKQLAVSIDKHFQEWAELGIKAVKEGAELPPRPDFNQILTMAKNILEPQEEAQPQPQQPNNGGQ